MVRISHQTCAAALLALSGLALAQPSITSLGGGVAVSVTDNIGGAYYLGGSGAATTAACRWVLGPSGLTLTEIGGAGPGYMSTDGSIIAGTMLNTAPQILGNTATGVSPAFRTDPTLVVANNLPASNEFAFRRWTASNSAWQSAGGLPIVPSLMVYGSGSSGGSGGTFLSPNGMSPNGRFVVGQGYISSNSNSAGTTISANTFTWRPWIWDAQANGGAGQFTVLPTPFRTSSNTWRRRTGAAYVVSNDGSVIIGAQEHNVGTTPTADPDGGRLVEWRYNVGSGSYVMNFLPNGTNASGFPYTYSFTPGAVAMNAAGTTVVSRAADSSGGLYIARWNWNSGTGNWDNPVTIGSNLNTPATWLPVSVTSCGVPPNVGGTLAMSDDASVIVGSAVYSTCGSFMSGGFIWRQSDGQIRDWYDYLNSLNTPGVAPGGVYGPIGDVGDPTRGLPALGYPTAMSPSGDMVAGFQGGTQRIPGAQPWVLKFSGGLGCVAPAISLNPSATTTFSACTSQIILNVAASGSAPFTYQWYKDGNPIFNGTTASGSVVTGADASQIRISAPLTPADTGTYYARVTGQCGSPAQSTNAVVSLDPAFNVVATNDTCATAQVVTVGTNVLGAGQSPCNAYINDATNYSSCTSTPPKADRWFSFTPTTSGNYRLETCGSNYDTLLSIFDGCLGSEIACNNDYTTGPSSGCSSARSRIGSVGLNANQTYLIRLAAPSSAFLSTTNLMNLSISTAPASAANDSCFTAATAVIGTNPFDTTEASNDWTPTCQTNTTLLARDVWFAFTPTGRGKLRAATCPGTSYNTVLSIHDACGGGNQIACNDDASISGCSSQSIVSNVPVAGGVTYYIRVGGGSSTAFGAGVLTLDFQCLADFNEDGGVDGSDVGAFFTVWELGDTQADMNLDGGVDGADVEVFYTLWANGGC
ncbi:MAG: immunoglobulin domain-containing protein [Planctomycetes bacterium]|nr:immunoglobulin domain-containing protein [Planctomycetota bacterium]